MSLPRVVIDTNVLVAGLRSRLGASFRLLQLIGTGKFEICVSVPVVLEYEEVLIRQLPNLALNQEDIEAFIDYLCSVSKHQEIFFLWRPYLKDADDDMILELAVNAECKHIVSFNIKDFAGISKFGVKAISPKDFLKEIGGLK